MGDDDLEAFIDNKLRRFLNCLFTLLSSYTDETVVIRAHQLYCMCVCVCERGEDDTPARVVRRVSSRLVEIDRTAAPAVMF